MACIRAYAIMPVPVRANEWLCLCPWWVGIMPKKRHIFHPPSYALRRVLLVELNLCGDVCVGGYQPSTELEILISPPAEPASSPGEGEIHTYATLTAENTQRQPRLHRQTVPIQKKLHLDDHFLFFFFRAPYEYFQLSTDLYSGCMNKARSLRSKALNKC